jgi:hypothetical protein
MEKLRVTTRGQGGGGEQGGEMTQCMHMWINEKNTKKSYNEIIQWVQITCERVLLHFL